MTTYFVVEVVGDEGESLWQIITPTGNYLGPSSWDREGLVEIVHLLNRD